ncbi:MAG: DUF962 domain-containing protein [Pyrinomonadaceae bacterium]|nr:DUF962 domain-containing protein [Pyrinomonadaceae bacterium]
MRKKTIKTYTEFWDFYVSEHSNPINRLLHFVGTTLALVLLFWFLVSGTFIFIPLCLVVGYGFAWVGHFLVEGNKPATFQYPLWSFISDYKMIFYMLTGKMNREVDRVTTSLKR